VKYIDEFRNKKLIRLLSQKIQQLTPARKINLMEVCGTHTQNFRRFGLGELLPANLKLISGPGCPVCVSPQSYIDQAIELAQKKDNIILTFGDMLRIPGTKSSLEKERAAQAEVKVVYSALDSLKIAREHPLHKVIFLAVGFETTAPTIALTLLAAKKEKIKNLYFLSSLKLIPAAMEYLLQDKRLRLDGFLCPGHVSAIIGTQAYDFIPKRYKIPCCVAGFEPLDILEGIYFLLKNVAENNPTVSNQYKRVVRKAGNPKAREIMARVFRVTDSQWRGLGEIPRSGLSLKKEFWQFDVNKKFSLKRELRTENRNPNCRCGDVLKGLIIPPQCRLFSCACRPEHPVGPCMVSSEGACNAYYRYRG